MSKIKFMNLALISLSASLFCVAMNNRFLVLLFLVISGILFILDICSPKKYLVSYMYRKNNQSIFEYKYVSLMVNTEEAIKLEIIKPLMIIHNIRMSDIVILGIVEV